MYEMCICMYRKGDGGTLVMIGSIRTTCRHLMQNYSSPHKKVPTMLEYVVGFAANKLIYCEGACSLFIQNSRP